MSSSSSNSRTGANAGSGKCDELRSMIRASAAADNSTSGPVALLTTLFLTSEGGNSSMELSCEKFCQVIGGVRGVRTRFTPSDLIEIYSEAAADIGGGVSSKVTKGAIVDYFSAAMSRARAWSIKLRSAIMQDFDGVEEYKRAFSSMSTGSSNIVDINAFTDFAEDMLDLDENTISESESKSLYAMFDANNDGEVSLDDFLVFMLGQSVEAIRQLESGNGEIIVDVKISSTPIQEGVLRSQGYTQMLPDPSVGFLGADHGSFGKGTSMWIWKRKQGTCSGRLKPIVDIQLDSSSAASNSVLIGYQCISPPVGKECVWIKRATSDDEEKDAIVDIKVTIGKSKNPADKIWASPGVGWVLVGQAGSGANFGHQGIFTSNDAFVWFRPVRTRTVDSAMVTVMNTVASFSEETRQAKLVAAVRSAVRSYVPLAEMKRLANLQMESNDSSSQSTLRSDRMFDYTALFHIYGDVRQGIMKKSQFSKMLMDIGVNMDQNDITRCYNYFDKDLNGMLSRVEFANFMALTDYEIDAVVEKIRVKLLNSKADKSKSNGSSRSSANSSPIKNALRESRILSHIFRHVNANKDSILSLDEVLDLAARLEIFLTEAEARQIAKDMDANGDDRIEEADFITFMKRTSEVVVKKAQRLHSAASTLRRWLIRGSSTTSSASIAASDVQWNEFKAKHEKSTLRKFPGYLSCEDLLINLAVLGVILTGSEARELMLIVAPESNGQIRQPDLHAFMNRTCRSIGELVALLERDVMKSVVDVYRTHVATVRTDGVPDTALADQFAVSVKDLVKRVQTSQASNVTLRPGLINTTAPQSSVASAVHDVVSIGQLKAGVEASMGRVPTQGAGMMPNLEEYACLAALVGALVADEETHGVNAKNFVEGICSHVVKIQARTVGGETVTLEAFCRELRRMIREEAKSAGGGRHYDFVSIFAAFDEDGGGTISLTEFKGMLNRFQLLDKLPEKQVPAFLESIDRGKKGFVNYEDFLAFAEMSTEDDDDDCALDDDDVEDEVGLSSNTPPASITRNLDCDWLLWFLWRQACRVAPRDPENALAELEAACVAADKRSSAGGQAAREITVKTFWQLLSEKKLNGSMTRGQYEKGIKFVVHDGTGKDNDPMDYESVTKYVVRMGRTFNMIVQQRRVVDEKKFTQLRASLKKELLDFDSSGNSCVDDENIVSPGQTIGSKFERVLRRLDTNSDGMLTVPEFKLALKRLKIRDEKKWSAAMIRRLFDESAARADGKLSIAGFGKMVRGDADVKGSSGTALQDLSDDEEDDVFSVLKAVTTDAALFRKASDILLELVPMVSSSYSPGAVTAHCDAVRAAVRHFFVKADPQGRGCVTEDEFRMFARKSGLQTRLRVAELRKLISKLRKRLGDETEDGRLYSGRGNTSSTDDSMIDYEKLCKLIGPAAESQPRSRIDALMIRLQEAAQLSSAQGRSFLALCTLTDPLLSGRITEQELAIVAKMLGCPITLPEVDIIKDQIAEIETENKKENKQQDGFGRDKDSRANKGSIDYRLVNTLIETYQSARLPATAYNLDALGTMRQSRALGALPSYATSSVTRVPGSTMRGVPALDISRALPTPGGLFLATPMHAASSMSASFDRNAGNALGSSLHGDRGLASAYDKSLMMLGEKIKYVSHRTQSFMPPFVFLMRRLETADCHNTGVVSEENLQTVLEDMGISLSPPDLFMLRSRFGNLQGNIDYEALVHALRDAQDTAVLRGPLAGAGSTWQTTPAVSRRVRELSIEGVDIQRAFSEYDFEGNGVVS